MDFSKFKQETNNAIKKYFKSHGFPKCVEVCYLMLQDKRYKSVDKFQSNVHGEIAETVLEVLLLDYINKNNLSWFISKGLILKNLDKKEEYLTELDLVLFTEFQVICFEVKSYQGEKKIFNECFLQTAKSSVDIYKQNMAHVRALRSNIEPFCVGDKSKSILPCAFCFSLGGIEDRRTKDWKINFPVFTENNLNKYLDILRKNTLEVWNLVYVKKAVYLIEKNNSNRVDSHFNYVSSLHSGNENRK